MTSLATRRSMISWAFFFTVISLGPASAEGRPEGVEGGTSLEPRPCVSSRRFCAPEEETPEVVLESSALEKVISGMSGHNLRVLARTDSLYRAGRFGRPFSEAARAGARRHFQLRVETAFDYLTDAAAEPSVRRASEDALLLPLGNRYANTAVYPIRPLDRALVGAGGFCLEYDLSRRVDGVYLLGGVPTRMRRDRVSRGDGVACPAQSVEFGDRIHKTIALVFEERFCGKACGEVIIDRGDTLDLITVSDMEGLYVREAGIHRMTAMILWRSHTSGDRDPERPRLGACAYFPHIALRLPAFLPDIDLDDLRTFALPSPILSMGWIARHERVEWFEATRNGGFEPWEAAGPRPAEADRRFPDL